MMQIYVPSNIALALELLHAGGYEAYIVGGCVRDCLLGKTPNDYDITTSAMPEEMKSVFSGYRLIETGLKHGTLTVLISDNPIEITTFRIDGDYSDSRHPDNVSFTRSLSEDLARRDFTVNAMAYSPEDGLVDLFDGQNDLNAGILRAVGQPEKRFTEDALRIMRGLRFASVLGFSLEQNTADAMLKCSGLLDNVSGERIYTELKSLLCGKNVGEVLRRYYRIMEPVIPGLTTMSGFDQHNYHHRFDLLEHTIRVVEAVPPTPVLRFSALLHDIGKQDCFTMDEKGVGHFYGHPKHSMHRAEAIFDRLCSDSATRSTVLKLIEQHDTPIEPEQSIILKRLGRLGEDTLRMLFTLKRADTIGQGVERQTAERMAVFDRCDAILQKVLSEKLCYSINMLNINGSQLIALGYRQGIALGKMLNEMLEQVTNGQLDNTYESLSQYAVMRLPKTDTQ